MLVNKQEAPRLIHEWSYAPREKEDSRWRMVIPAWGLSTVLERSHTDGMGTHSWNAINQDCTDGVAALEAAVYQLAMKTKKERI